jgi:hypothetical protein
MGAFATLLRVIGLVADDAANVATELPVKAGAVAVAVANPATVTAADKVHLTTDLTRRLRVLVEGDVADAGVATAAMPIKTGGVAETTPAGTGVADADAVHFTTDLLRRQRVAKAVEHALGNWADLTNIGADGYYPSEGGLDLAAYSDVSITGKVICTASNSSALSFQATNDEDATPANRDWITLYVYRSDTNTVINTIATIAGATTTFAIALDKLDFKYFRVFNDMTVGGNPDSTLILKARLQG